jgi:hypothetical protein
MIACSTYLGKIGDDVAGYKILDEVLPLDLVLQRNDLHEKIERSICKLLA